MVSKMMPLAGNIVTLAGNVIHKAVVGSRLLSVCTKECTCNMIDLSS